MQGFEHRLFGTRGCDTDSDAPALPEEIIYYDEQGAICRCLNWREAQRTINFFKFFLF